MKIYPHVDILIVIVKANIHPTWYQEAKVTCACGNTFITGSTLPEIRVEICSNCHPFFTGQQKFVDTLGQVERFSQKREAAKTRQAERQIADKAKKTRYEEARKDKPTLKELLMQARKQAAS